MTSRVLLKAAMTSVLALILLAIMGRQDANAVTFNQIVPTSCPSSMNYTWSSSNPLHGWEQHWNGSGYHNNQSSIRYFLANPYVGNIQFHVVNKDLKPNDNLILQQGTSAMKVIGGISTMSSWEAVVSASLVVPIKMTFSTSASDNGAGYTIDSLRYCSAAPPGNPPILYTTIADGPRYSGIVLGTNDTVYMAIAGVATGRRLNIAVWPGPNGVSNVDLFAQCGSLPTPSSYFRMSSHTGSEEYMQILPSDCGSNSTIYLAVNSISGAGGFHLMTSRMKDAGMFTLKGAVEGATAPELFNVKEVLRTTSKRVYGASDGQIVIKQFDIVNVAYGSISNGDDNQRWNNCENACLAQFGVDCDICFVRATGSASAPHAGLEGHVKATIGYWDPALPSGTTGLAHEFGHFLFPVYPDEYPIPVTGDLGTCGHSIMYNAENLNNFCTDFNHNKDREPSSPSEPQASVWSYGSAKFASQPQTPDWYYFNDHDYVGNIVINSY